ncbi:TIGR02444 family protein [Pseudohongiella spirulinae]|uniref:TIGR02444 family protein n=1 Tax=Pseudohongiella spirulinae TaxID=1249552 RepID=UPI000717B1D1|nr:TIGR02444 family protein [Pseudohongiella spirulinae]
MISLSDFAITVYRASDVQSACLQLQDDFNADIPYLFFLCWYGVYKGQISDELAAVSEHHNQSISRQVVQPLRQARRWMKMHWSAQSPLREKIKAAELQAELALLEDLQQMAAPIAGNGHPGTEAIRANIQRYLQSLPVLPDEHIWLPVLRGAAGVQHPASD